MYAHSNELEEIGIISLSGVNVESDPQKAILLGVCVTLLVRSHFPHRLCPETELFHVVHSLEFSCACCSQCEGAPIMDRQARPYTVYLSSVILRLTHERLPVVVLDNNCDIFYIPSLLDINWIDLHGSCSEQKGGITRRGNGVYFSYIE